jgi:hypothetical protein
MGFSLPLLDILSWVSRDCAVYARVVLKIHFNVFTFVVDDAPSKQLIFHAFASEHISFGRAIRKLQQLPSAYEEWRFAQEVCSTRLTRVFLPSDINCITDEFTCCNVSVVS